MNWKERKDIENIIRGKISYLFSLKFLSTIPFEATTHCCKIYSSSNSVTGFFFMHTWPPRTIEFGDKLTRSPRDKTLIGDSNCFYGEGFYLKHSHKQPPRPKNSLMFNVIRSEFWKPSSKIWKLKNPCSL